jgi:hypothetical protein
MKWWQDVFIWLGISIFFVLGVALSYQEGTKSLVEHCKTYGAYKVSDEEAMLCVVKPLLKDNQGELNYLRPNGKDAIKPGKMT